MSNRFFAGQLWKQSVLVLVLCLLCAFPWSGQAGARSEAPAAEFFESTNLWNAGIGGYETYRIPGVVVTKKGTVLAYTSARRTPGDWSNIDIVLRRSTDGGRSWSPSRVLAGNSQGVTDNPVAIADRRTGAVHFLFQKDYAHCFYMRSEDDGLTFSQPVDITSVFEQFRSEYDWHVIAPGVGHAIQLRSGRLLVPLWMSLGEVTGPRSRAHRPSAVATIYSDDAGKSWKRGAIIVNTTDNIPNPSESMAVELSDGRVMMNIRSESKNHRRLVSISPDGVSGWSEPKFDDELFEPICAASIVRFSSDPKDSRILFSNPDSADIPGTGKNDFRARQNLTLRMSYDDGKTWAEKRVIDPGITGYSDLAVGPDGTIYCVYESGGIRGKDTDNAHLSIARFNLAWLKGQSSLITK